MTALAIIPDALQIAELRIGYGSTPFGFAGFACHANGAVAYLTLQDAPNTDFMQEELQRMYPNAALIHADVSQLAQDLFKPHVNFSLYIPATDFQALVWRALLAIPRGRSTSYEKLADAIGYPPQAARAIGTAVGQNPVAYLIPCHRVLRKDGGMGGFRWGLPRKRELLANEGLMAAELFYTQAQLVWQNS